jgi:hypothetical protein
MDVVEALFSALSYGVLNLLVGSASLASPSSSPHELLSTVGCIAREEQTFDRADSEALDRVANTNRRTSLQLLDLAGRGNQVVFRFERTRA